VMLTASTPGAPALSRTFSTPRRRGALGILKTTSPSASVHPSAHPPQGWHLDDLGLPGPFAPAPLQDLRRYYGPVRPCASHRYSAPRGFCHLGSSLQATRQLRLVPSIEATGSPLPCQRLRRAHATYTPDATGATYRQLPGSGHAHESACLCPGASSRPGFGVIFDLSMRQQWFTHVRLLVAYLDPLSADRFRSRFPPRLLTGMTLRWFGVSACTATPEGLPPSLARHGLW